MIHFDLNKHTFKDLLLARMGSINIILTDDIAEDIITDCIEHIFDATQKNGQSSLLPATKEFSFFNGEEKRHATITLSNYLFDDVLNLDFYHRREQETESELLFSYKLFKDGTYATTPERIVHLTGKTYYYTDKELIADAVYDAIKNGEGEFINHLNKPVELSYSGVLFQLKDNTANIINLYYLPTELSQLGLTPTLKQYYQIERTYLANDKRFNRHRRYEPVDLMDLLEDIYRYFEINHLDGLALLKGVINNNKSTFERTTARVDNTSYPAVEIIREGYHPRRKYTRYTLNTPLIKAIIDR